jgi:tetratricopeptide (TPR) repeat protein
MSLADYAAGRMNVAEEHLEDSIRLLRKYRQESLLGEALNNLGWIRAFYLNDRSTAGLLLDESLLIARQCGDQWTLQEVLDSIGNLKTALGEVDAAEGFQEESLRICSDLGDAWSLPRTLTGFVRMAVARRQAERALRLSGAAAKLRDDVGMVLMTAEQAELDLLIEVARGQLPSDLADAAWWEGSHMTMNDAVGYALSHEPVVLGSH